MSKITGITISEDGNYSIIPIPYAEPSIIICKRRTQGIQNSRNKTRKTIDLVCSNLKPNTQYKIKLWYSSNHRGRAQSNFWHPYNTIQEAYANVTNKSDSDYKDKQKRCSGRVMGLFNTYKSSRKVNGIPVYAWPEVEEQEPNLITADVDPTLLRKYVLQTEWIFTTLPTETTHTLTLHPATWLAPMYRPDTRENGKGEVVSCCTLVGASSDRGGHIDLKFSLEENIPGLGPANKPEYFSNNNLIIGNKIEIVEENGENVYIPAYIAIK